jgi:putative Holliday junction resolvase
MRIAAFDVGRKHIGVAISDVTRTLARPVSVLNVSGRREGVAAVLREVTRFAAEEDGIEAIVVGLPRHLDGSPSDMTTVVQQFVLHLRAIVAVPVVLQDERLSSREAESRLAVTSKDWRARKGRLDAAAAAVMLQDYLDERGAAEISALSTEAPP